MDAVATPTTTLTPLTIAEQGELIELELIISRGMRTTLETGRALRKIRDKRLYKSRHTSFEAYCLAAWKFTDARANQLIAASYVADDLQKDTTRVVPQNEKQLRPLVELSESDRREAWEAAVETAGGQPRAEQVAHEAHIQQLLHQALESLPKERQLEVLQANHEAIQARAAVRKALSDAEANAKWKEKFAFHVRRLVAFAGKLHMDPAEAAAAVLEALGIQAAA